MLLPQFQPVPLGRQPEPFSHPDWLFEIKWDGFRSLAYVEGGECSVISRNGNRFSSFGDLAAGINHGLNVGSAILDGEIVCLDRDGKTNFTDLLFRRGEPRFYAFDLLRLHGCTGWVSEACRSFLRVVPATEPPVWPQD